MNLDRASISDPQFRDAVAAIDAGGLSALERLLTAHPRLLGERMRRVLPAPRMARARSTSALGRR